MEEKSSDPIIDIRCSITGMIMKKPVLAQDSIIYEEDAINDWLKEHNTSPCTRQIISEEVISVLTIKNYIEDYIKKHQELKDEVYTPIYAHRKYKDEIDVIIQNEKWDELKQYTGFEYVLFDTTKIRQKLFGKCTSEMLKYVIDNTIDLDYKRSNGARMIHAICNSSMPEIIKYIIDKGIDAESASTNSYKIKPIDNLLKYQTTSTIMETIHYFNKIKMEQLQKLHKNGNIKTFDEYYNLLTYFKENDLIQEK